MDESLIEQMRTWALGSDRPKRKPIPGPRPRLSLYPDLSGEVVLAKHDGVIAAKEHCRKCSNTGFVEVEGKSRKCDCIPRLRRAAKGINALRAPWVHLDAAKAVDMSQHAPAHLSSTVEALRAPEDACPFVLVMGESGLGKSYIAAWAGFDACLSGLDARWVMAEQVIEEVKLAYGQGESMGSALAKYVSCDLLILDELKTFRGKHGAEVVSYLLRRRWDAKSRTVITTNLTERGIVEAVDAQMAYRLAQSRVCKVKAPRVRGAG